MPITPKSAAIAGLALGSLLVSGCSSSDSTTVSRQSLCVAKVEFSGRTYVENTQQGDTVKQGKKLGMGRTVGCAGPDADGPGGEITIYEAVGSDPSQAVIAESPYGLLQNDAAGSG
jgi:hypothetical protein